MYMPSPFILIFFSVMILSNDDIRMNLNLNVHFEPQYMYTCVCGLFFEFVVCYHKIDILIYL